MTTANIHDPIDTIMVCPATGLPVKSRPDWTDRRFGGDYRLTIRVVGDRILLSQPCGYAELDDIVESLDLTDAIVQEHIDPSAGYVHISDFAGMRGITREARKHYIRRMGQRENMLGLIYFGVGPLLRVMINLAKHLSIVKFNVQIVKDYNAAMSAALRLFGADGDRYSGPAASDGPPPAESVDPDPAHVVDQLLRFIGDIDWKRHGVEMPDQVGKDHPFHPVFDAIALMKGELDELIEERHRTVAALRESQKQFNEVLKNSRDILFKRDLKNGTYEYVSDAITDLLGITPETVYRMGFGGLQAMVHPEDLPRFLAFNKKLLDPAASANADHVIEYRLRDSQGRYRWFSDSHAIVRDAEGQPVFVIGSNRDITDQKVAEQELKGAYERFTMVLDSISAHIYVADMQTFEILFMNRAMRDDFGDSRLGDRCFEVFRNATDSCPHCTNKKLLDAHGRPTGVHTWEGLNPVQNRWYLNHDRAIRWVDGRMVRIQISMDISRIKALEGERQQIAERLRHTRKLEAVSTMAGGVAHNFNNLLMVVLGNLELMRLETQAGSSLSRRIDAAEKSAQRASDLSTLMLTYVGQTRLNPQTVDLNAILSEMVDVLKTTVAEKATLTVDACDSPGLIHADPSKVCQVITNLVTNAVEASGNQPIEVHLGVGDQHCDVAQLSRLAPGESLPEGRYIWLRVSDNGRGMDQETLEKVFDPFFTTKFTGRGMGMAAVMGIVRAHQGGVRIDSRPDAGTAVTVYFPERKQTAPPVSAAPVTMAKAVPKRRGTALLVDDEPMVLELGKQMLAILGFDVLTAVNGLDALTVFKANRDRIHIAVLDINMPRMGGRETVARLRGMGASLPVLIASGFTETQAREKIGDARVNGFIKKPFRMEQLQEKIDAIVRSTVK